MNIKLLTFIVGVSIFATGCVTHYRYESTGMVTSSSAAESRALIYWFADEGGLWYDKDQAVLDSDVTLRVCGGLPKTFVPVGDDPGNLQIRSNSGDMQTAKIEASGDVVALQQPKRLRVGDGACGQIEVSREEASIKDLAVSVKPEIIILCKNIRDPASYPRGGRYKFTAVTRTTIKDDRDPADFCNAE
jgi:hypothetical protein